MSIFKVSHGQPVRALPGTPAKLTGISASHPALYVLLFMEVIS